MAYWGLNKVMKGDVMRFMPGDLLDECRLDLSYL